MIPSPFMVKAYGEYLILGELGGLNIGGRGLGGLDQPFWWGFFVQGGVGLCMCICTCA